MRKWLENKLASPNHKQNFPYVCTFNVHPKTFNIPKSTFIHTSSVYLASFRMPLVQQQAKGMPKIKKKNPSSTHTHSHLIYNSH